MKSEEVQGSQFTVHSSKLNVFIIPPFGLFSAARDRSPAAAGPKYFRHRNASTFALRNSGCCDRGTGRAPDRLKPGLQTAVQR